jgi:RND family efflux transporter MFP subunit
MLDSGTPKVQPSTGQHETPRHETEDHGFDPKEPIHNVPPARTRTVVIAAAFGVLALAGVFLLGALPAKKRRDDLLARSGSAGPPTVVVSIANPRRSAPTSDLFLPGTVRAFQDTAIYARTNGYVKRWLVDIGDRVAAGQLLAEIEVPELDQQIDQARASLNQVKARLVLAEANVGLAESTLKRYQNAAPAGGITAQELDEKRASLDVSRASVAAAKSDVEAGEANVRRLLQLKDFAAVAAPFSGTITARVIDQGTLVSAGNAKGQELFHIVQTNPARVFVNVPQASAPGIEVGAPAEVLAREYPNRPFKGVVARTARAIDDTTRTLLADVEVPNEDGLLLAGMYTQVHFHVPRRGIRFLVPQSALVVTADGTQVATIDSAMRAHFENVTVDTDFGNEIAVLGNLTEKDRIVTNPGEKLVEGVAVKIAEVEKATEVPAKK